jgi:hypothetical protein
MDLVELVKNFGLPTAIAIFFIWRDYQSSKEHKEDLKNIAVKAVTAIDAGTEAIKDSVTVIDKNSERLGENTSILNRVEGVLSNRGYNNGNGN